MYALYTYKMTCILVCVALIGFLADAPDITNALKYSRASGRLTVELLVVADYSEFNKWYQLTSMSHTHAQRVTEATDNVKKYVGALIHSSNNVYRGLENQNIYIDIKLVDILVMTSASASPWTETVKVSHSSSFTVDPTKALPIFMPMSVDLQRTIPHDHAMILTMYELFQGSGSTFSGYAYTEAECKQKSVSIVNDNEDFYTAQLIAHEIGHSLGCEHDGNGNSCSSSSGYAMAASFILANRNKWTFSSCSIDYIRNYLNYLNTHHQNCLQQINNTHPSSQVATAFQHWYGQVYNLDEQCRIHYGPQSYLCRDQYHGDYTTVCLKMFCYDPVKKGCYYLDGGDGTPCDTGKWCMSNDCVQHNGNHLQAVDGACVAGDQQGIVYNGRTCQEIGTNHGSDCSRSDVKAKCCNMCRHLHQVTTPTDIDGQCRNIHGSGSYMCRGAVAYDGKSYADTVCWDLQCHDPNRANWCLSTAAADNTSCGYHKWCKNHVCVQDLAAPAVPDNCPWGNQQGVASYGLTCDQLMQPEHQAKCYDSFTSKVCCATCNAIRKNIYGCEFGDRINNCVHSRCNSYDSNTRRECCKTCIASGIVG